MEPHIKQFDIKWVTVDASYQQSIFYNKQF